MLSAAQDLTVIGSSGVRKASAICAALDPDIVLLTVSTADPNNVRAARAILSKNPRTRIVVLSQSDEPVHAHAMLSIGVSGYLLYVSDLSDLAISIRAVHSGQIVCSLAITNALIQSPLKY